MQNTDVRPSTRQLDDPATDRIGYEDLLRALGDRVKERSNGRHPYSMSLSPFREETKASLKISPKPGGGFLVHDFGDPSHNPGAFFRKIVAWASLELGRDVDKPAPVQKKPALSKAKKPRPSYRETASYAYRDAAGMAVFEVVRKECRGEPKTFSVRYTTGGKTIWKLPTDGPRPLYHLDEITKRAKDTVFVCEGEKDADAVRALGLLATTCPFGSRKWLAEHTETLRGRDVVVVPDCDRAGKAHAEQVSTALGGVAASVKVLDLGLESRESSGPDVYDWIRDHGHTKEELLQLCASTAPVARVEPIPVALSPTTSRPWTPVDPVEEIEWVDLSGPMKEPEWVLPDYLGRQEVGTLCGWPDSSKTSLAMSCSLAVVTGQPVVGIQPAARGPAIYFDEEMGPNELRRYAQRFGAPDSGLFLSSLEGLSLTTPQALTRIERAIASIRPAFIVFDSLREMMGAGDENDSAAASEIYRIVRWFVFHYELSALVIAHLKKPHRDAHGAAAWGPHLLRGSGHHLAGISSCHAVRKDPLNPSVLELYQWKRRPGAQLQATRLYQFDSAPDDPEAVTLTHLGSTTSDPAALPAQRRIEDYILQFIGQHGSTSKAQLEPHAKKMNVAPRTLERGLQHLATTKRLEYQKEGRSVVYFIPGQTGDLFHE